MDEPNDGLTEEAKIIMAGMAAEFEQMKQGVKDVGEVMYIYYTGMKEAGFSADEAMVMTVAYQNAMMALSLGGDS